MLLNHESFVAKAEIFFVHLANQLKINNIQLEQHWNLDHLCYRVESQVRYLAMKDSIDEFAELLVESEVNGRLIASYKLNQPLQFVGRMIDVVELPAPKPGKNVREGFEHIEVVVDASFDELKSRFSSCKFSEAGLSKSFNPELAVKMDGCAVKFHHLSLESVVTVESNKRIFAALNNSKALELLKPYNPQVVGTYPLGIQLDKSDLDILLFSNNLDKLVVELGEWFLSYQNYRLEKNDDHVFAQFTFAGVPFEIFAQSIATTSQKAFLHFNVEERLLKLGGEKIKKRVMGLRLAGEKTEPAFAKALGLTGDAYEELLKLQVCSDDELLVFLERS